MRIFSVIAMTFIFSLGVDGFAASPPFSSVKIYGKTDITFNKVSLFESGRSNKPIKTETVSSTTGEYRITIDIPSDMRKKNDYYIADMRFWNDANKNGLKETNEAVSKCHFIVWAPSTNKVYFQVYKGRRLVIDSPYFKYYFQ